VKPPRRQVDTNTVVSLAESINRIGLINPITVLEQADTADYILVTGLHRLEAFRHLKPDSIPVFILPASTAETEARMMEISENLHRLELTALERAEQVDEWRQLAKVRKLSAPSNTQPAESGAREAARELGVDEKTVRNASKIASITPEAKEAARNAGIDDNQSNLLKVAAALRSRSSSRWRTNIIAIAITFCKSCLRARFVAERPRNEKIKRRGRSASANMRRPSRIERLLL
jgi:ParB family chromosome partitioning protein